MTEDEYTQHVREQRRLARQRLDDLLYDLRCTIWPRTPWTLAPADPIEWEDQARRDRAAFDLRTAAQISMSVVRPGDPFRLIAPVA